MHHVLGRFQATPLPISRVCECVMDQKKEVIDQNKKTNRSYSKLILIFVLI